ncbi:hypothetical protein BDB00DRAFT_875267 [Zychaea mexicana]|uniref:uncharacterized protein n=1 Tax=Zychaea mexicana TaxID=64656 RepID=UPI0022FDB815|nr:uncharacterized protein BDB00DRAFT_875267 [Zychaea mexicana]KAI9490528.1 hypothetical protein BDB00DRAFT_875267 [Zychaea mexicana]
MEGLQRRFQSKKPTTHPEDESEFLDEEEQERLLDELREQNEKSNLGIQRGIIVIGILVSTIYAIFFYDLATSKVLSVPRIPMPLMQQPIPSLIPVPEFAAMMSMVSLYTSIYTFATTCKLSALEIIWLKEPTPSRGIGQVNILTASLAGFAGIVSPCIALLDMQTSTLEIAFWSVPLLVLGLMLLGLRMMVQVEGKIADLDKARYKYKGA